MKKLSIKGTVQKIDLGMGFWGIIDQNGNNYRPVFMPAQLKHNGRMVSVTIEKVEDEASIFMWGIPVKITSFST